MDVGGLRTGPQSLVFSGFSGIPLLFTKTLNIQVLRRCPKANLCLKILLHSFLTQSIHREREISLKPFAFKRIYEESYRAT